LDRLPEAQREALTLHYLQGWPLGDIGRHLGRSRAAVAGLIKRGLKQLRLLLHDSE
jgi:RNA polymerase sigma-70 factor (ECF subfamily)